MSLVSTENSDTRESSVQPYRYIPTEVCEHIIDMLYSLTVKDTTADIATLHSCSLVCRDWRVRAQKTLFFKVQLSDGPSLHKLSAVLDLGHHLRHYVHEVLLTGHHLHTTASILTSFPAVLMGRLPSLRSVAVVHLISTQTERYPGTSSPPKMKLLPFIPLHRSFPALLSSFTTLSHLLLQFTTFSSFTEFVRLLQRLPNLKALACNSVRWLTSGPSGGFEAGSLTLARTGRHVVPPLAPKLRELYLSNIAMYAVNTLVSACGPHLTAFGVTLPLLDDLEESSHNVGVDLNACLELRNLHVQFTPGLLDSPHSVDLVKAMLTSWKLQHSARLQISAYKYHQFTRQGFTDILHALGPVIDTWIPPPLPSRNNSKDPRYLNYQLVVRIHEQEGQKQWWRDCMNRCFPTWVRLKRLHIDFRTPADKHSTWGMGASRESVRRP